MNILELKFTEADFAGKDIASLPDRPSDRGMSAAELKARFDMIPKILLAMGAFNRLIDALSTDGAEAIGIKMDLEQIRTDITTLKHLEEPRNAAELARVQAELERIHAELARVQAEALRVEAENARLAAEEARVESENQRQSKENERGSLESARVQAEAQRISGENERNESESARRSAEEARVNKEAVRVQAEEVRIANENGREESRQNFRFCGEWQSMAYKRYNMVRHLGKVYLATSDTENEPPYSDWVLISSEGKSLNIGGTFPNLEALKAAYPQGDTRMFTVGNAVYMWSDEWISIGSIGGGFSDEYRDLLDGLKPFLLGGEYGYGEGAFAFDKVLLKIMLNQAIVFLQKIANKENITEENLSQEVGTLLSASQDVIAVLCNNIFKVMDGGRAFVTENELEQLSINDVEAYALTNNLKRTEQKESSGDWVTEYRTKKNKLRIKVRNQKKNSLGKWVTLLQWYKFDGVTIEKTVTITEYKQGNQWITEVV